MSVFVFRINYDDRFRDIRTCLLNEHKLRQGWGWSGMSINQSLEDYQKIWIEKNGNTPENNEDSKKRYNILKPMLEVQKGDYLIIPKISTQEEYVCRSFIIARCSKEYCFDEGICGDFGHYLEVDQIISCSYDFDLNTETINSKFSAYQSAINRVRSGEIIQAVNNLVKHYETDSELFEKESIDLISIISSATKESRKTYLQEIVQSLRKLPNDKFEKIIVALFEKNGYTLTDNNWYDSLGGDIDLVFEGFNKHTLMHNIYDICDLEMPHIYVQAKKKTGKDFADKTGIEQLIKMKCQILENNASFIVINLTDEFTETAVNEAKKEDIILINGEIFASLLVRYGIEVDYFSSQKVTL